jgi:hypothetical protein
LLGSVSAAAGVFLLPASAYAQSTTCSQTGTTINCVDGANTVLTAGTTPGTNTVPGPGLVTADTTTPSTTTYTATGPIATTGLTAVNLTSTGGALTFVPVSGGAPLNITTTGGVGANGLQLNTAGQAATVTVGNISTSGANSFGVLSTGGTDLTLKTGDITTTGATSRGIQAINQTGFVNITAGNITTTDRAISVAAAATSDATVVAGNISTGASGVLANGNNVSITTGNVATTNGFGVIGQALAGGTGGVVVRTGNVTSTNGSGVGGSVFNTVGGVDIGCGNVTSNSPGSAAVFAQNNGNGALTIKCGAVTNVGNNAVYAQSFGLPDGGNIAITVASAASSNTNFSTLFAQTSGTGTITVNAGTVTGGANPAGVGAAGIDLITGTGAIDAGYGNVTTIGTALRSNSTGTLNLRGSGATLKTTGDGATGALLNANGVTGNLGNVTTSGLGAQGAIINSTAPVNLTIGNVATTGNGVTVNAGANAVTLTTGTVTASEAGATGTVINSNGAVTFTGGKQTANGADALRINGGAGAINATVAGAATTGTGNAVEITGTGPLTFANTGSITTTGTGSNGIRITGVTTAAVTCGNVSTTGAANTAVLVSAGGDTNVACGTVSATGAGSIAIRVANTAGTTTVSGGTTLATGAGSRGIVVTSSAPAASGLVTINTGAVTANSDAVLAIATGGANVVVNANGNLASSTGTGISATTAGTTFVTIGAGTTTNGLQGVNLQGTAGNTLVVNGTLRNAGGTTPYTVLAGGPFTLTLGANGTIVGPLTFTTGNDTFNNQGTFALPATLDFLTGTDVLNNTGTLTAFNGTSVVSNLETFNNAGGLIDLRDGATNDVVNLANSNYVATGAARLGVDVGGTGVITADRLVIGGTTTGTTTVLANVLNPVIDTTGAVIVDSTLNNLTAGQFVLGGASNYGLVNYAIQIRGGDAYIVSTPDARTYDMVFAGRQARDLWYKSADIYTSYASARRLSFGEARQRPIGFWAQLGGDRETAGDRSRTATAFGTSFNVSDRLRTDYRGAQAGIDFGTANFVIGVTGGYERAASTSDAATRTVTEGMNYGAYAQFGMTSGIYASALIKRDDYRAQIDNGAIQAGMASPRGHSTGAQGEIGFRAGGADKINFDLGAGIAYVRTDMDTFNFGNITFDANRMESMRGQVHARVSFAGDVAPFIEARGFHEFRGDTSYQLRSGSAVSALDGPGKGSWVRIEGGIAGGKKGGPMLSVWGDLGDTRGYGLRGGFRF